MARDDSGFKTFRADGAIPAHSLVKVTATGVDVNGIADDPIGATLNEAFAANDQVTVKLLSAPGTLEVIASAALAVGANVFTAASGEVGASASTATSIGQVVQPATSADQDIIEILPGPIAVPVA